MLSPQEPPHNLCLLIGCLTALPTHSHVESKIPDHNRAVGLTDLPLLLMRPPLPSCCWSWLSASTSDDAIQSSDNDSVRPEALEPAPPRPYLSSFQVNVCRGNNIARADILGAY
jgi:hypothetical protein